MLCMVKSSIFILLICIFYVPIYVKYFFFILKNELGKKANRATSNIFNKDVPVEAEEGYLTEIRTILASRNSETNNLSSPQVEQFYYRDMLKSSLLSTTTLK